MEKKGVISKKSNLLKRKRVKKNLLIIVGGSILISSLHWWTWTQKQTKVLGTSTQLDANRIVQLINIERAKKGAAGVTINEKLNEAALKKGESMFAQNYWAHVAPDGTQPWSFISAVDYAYQSAGENLGRDFYTEESLVQAWLDSPTHKANLLNANFEDTGITILDGQIKGKPVLLVVNLFAKKKTETGEVAQIAIYEGASDSLVLAGEVIPQGELRVQKAEQLTGKQIAFVGGTLVLLGYMIYNLSLAPRGRKRKR